MYLSKVIIFPKKSYLKTLWKAKLSQTLFLIKLPEIYSKSTKQKSIKSKPTTRTGAKHGQKKHNKHVFTLKRANKRKLVKIPKPFRRSNPKRAYLLPINTPEQCKIMLAGWKQLFKEGKWDIPSISNALKSRTRFHNNKAKYVLEALNNWGNIRQIINNDNDIIKLRNNLAENIKGLGLKEASHFLRNIGSSNNQIAILDRHILRNLKALKIINEAKIKSNKHYLEIEQSFLKFSKDIKIPIDHLDLLFWHKEHNEFFKWKIQ